MDLGAYVQIDELEEIMKRNGIEIPRLRGLRLMGKESPVSESDRHEYTNNILRSIYEDMCCSVPRFAYHSRCFVYSSETHRVMEKYIDDAGELRWDRLHGKKRKVAKYAVKRAKRSIDAEISAWNKYAGRSDVMYVHARIGGGNWDLYGGPELAKQPWFLEKVDDTFDNTYCNIYARIDPYV